jgi:hypothetical protein
LEEAVPRALLVQLMALESPLVDLEVFFLDSVCTTVRMEVLIADLDEVPKLPVPGSKVLSGVTGKLKGVGKRDGGSYMIPDFKHCN